MDRYVNGTHAAAVNRVWSTLSAICLLHYLMRCKSLAVNEDRDVGELSLLEHTMN
jgi:hypothetical protein